MTDTVKVIKRMKQASEAITADLATMMQNVGAFARVYKPHPEVEGRFDEVQVKQIAVQRHIARMTEAIMEFREELILIGVSYEEETGT